MRKSTEFELDFVLLADRPAAIPTIARWYFDEWSKHIPGETLETTEASLANYLHRDRIPLMVLAIVSDQVAGVAQLKHREMDIYPEKEHWLGGVFVSPQHRGERVGYRLAERIAKMARDFDVLTLYLQTEKLNGGLYAQLGWKPCEQVTYRGREVLVMERRVGAKRFTLP